MGGILLLTGLLAAWIGPSVYRVKEEDRLRSAWRGKSALEAEAASLLERISDSTRGESEKILSYGLPAGASLEDSGSRINLNWVRRYILGDSPELRSLFVQGSPDELQAFRQKNKLGTNLDVYAFFFEPGVLASLFTLKSPMNINTVDEFAFENVMSQATGDEISGALWRDRLRSLRLSGRLIKDEFELRAWFGADWDKVALFTSALPEWNVNTLKPALLRAVLGCTQFKLHNPDAAASALLGARDARYLSDADLRTILGLPKDNPIWAHLGTESSAWTLKLAGESGLVLEVDFMVRPKGEAASVFRMTALRWSHA
jgi:hypothetical protein